MSQEDEADPGWQVAAALSDNCTRCGVKRNPRETIYPDLTCAACRKPEDPERGVLCRDCGTFLPSGQSFPFGDHYCCWDCGKVRTANAEGGLWPDEMDDGSE